MTAKENLLKELESLGVRADGRKIRSDKNKSRGNYVRHTSAKRSDAGKKRNKYDISTPNHNKRVFEQFLNLHTDKSTGEDDLPRDVNMIFSPNVTSYYKEIKSQSGYTYKSAVKRNNHPEYLRWKWYFSEYENAETVADRNYWRLSICNWYFIKPEDIDVWTYDEWAWAYYSYISGEENRLTKNKKILSYDSLIKGEYGKIVFDENGDIIWERKQKY